MRKKQLFTIILALFVTMQVGAQTWNIGYPTASNVTATLDADGTLTISGTGNMRGDWDMIMFDWDLGPRIPPPWWHIRLNIRTVVINEGVTNIGNHMFQHSRNLTSVSIPNSVTSIGRDAFRQTGLTSVIIPNSVTSIGRGAFWDAPLTEVIIPYGVTSIGDEAFRTTFPFHSSALTSVILPNSITKLGNQIFEGNINLTSITIPNSVTIIGGGAFRHTGLTSVVIPNSVTYIGVIAFEHTPLTSITIPNSVTSIGLGAFANTSLTSITLPENITSIEESTFRHTPLVSIVIPENVTSIGWRAFENTNITSITIPRNVTEIGSGNGGAFGGTPLETVNLNAINLTRGLFGSATLRTVNIGNEVQTIPNGAFNGSTSLTTITIPNSVTSIGDMAFRNTGLTSIAIPNSVTSIGDRAFENSGLTTITIGSNVESIGSGLFTNTPNLSEIHVMWSTPLNIGRGNLWQGSWAIGREPERNIRLHIPQGTLSNYIDTPFWRDFRLVENGTEVAIKIDEITLGTGESATLTATIIPAQTVNIPIPITWRSSNEDLVTVDNTGRVTATTNNWASGTARIYATIGGLTGFTDVTVIIPVTDISFYVPWQTSREELQIGDRTGITVLVTPIHATNRNVVWHSSNTAVATVVCNSVGFGTNRIFRSIVTAVAAGTTTITGTTECGGKTVTVEVTVVMPTENISLNRTATRLTIGESETLIATVTPANAGQGVWWSSSNTNVATVDQSGTVTAVGIGTATITVSQSHLLYATCQVTVIGGEEYFSWLTIPTIDIVRSGNTLIVQVVGVSADTFNRLTVNGTEVAPTEDGRWIIDISTSERREIRASNSAGVIITRIHQ